MNPPENLLPWLTYTQFLTKKLQEKSGDTKLTVLAQQWSIANEWDSAKLGLTAELVLHREIITSAWGKPCWYARTILPKSTYDANSALFERLKTEPLGNLIFNGSVIQRESLIYNAISQREMEFHWLMEHHLIDSSTKNMILWARLSTFKLSKAVIPAQAGIYSSVGSDDNREANIQIAGRRNLNGQQTLNEFKFYLLEIFLPGLEPYL